MPSGNLVEALLEFHLYYDIIPEAIGTICGIALALYFK